MFCPEQIPGQFAPGSKPSCVTERPERRQEPLGCKSRNILPRCSDLAKLGRPKTTPSATTGPATQNAAEPGGGLASSAAAQRIVSQYDVTDISPQSFSQMLQKLRQAGSLSGQDYQALSSIPGEVQKSGIAPDDSVNLLQLYAAKVQGLARQSKSAAGATARSGDAQAAAVRRQWQLLQKMATIQSGSGAGLSAAA